MISFPKRLQFSVQHRKKRLKPDLVAILETLLDAVAIIWPERSLLGLFGCNSIIGAIQNRRVIDSSVQRSDMEHAFLFSSMSVKVIGDHLFPTHQYYNINASLGHRVLFIVKFNGR